jgi:transcriptional regulator with XRE-family HTH domain
VPTRASHPILKKVGARLRKVRTAKGWSQEQVALAADMDRSYVSGLERGEFNVSLVALARLAKALKIEVSDLF